VQKFPKILISFLVANTAMGAVMGFMLFIGPLNSILDLHENVIIGIMITGYAFSIYLGVFVFIKIYRFLNNNMKDM
jgi:hypothetical protein